MIDETNFERVDLDGVGRMSDLAREAKCYLLSHEWCWHVFDVYLSADYGGVVFLANIKPFVAPVGRQIWVVSGELPIAYVDTRACRTPVEALAVYCVSAAVWVSKTLKGKPTKVAIKLHRHGDLAQVASEGDLRSAIEALAVVTDRLVSDEASFLSLSPGLQDELKDVRRGTRTWIKDPNADAPERGA